MKTQYIAFGILALIIVGIIFILETQYPPIEYGKGRIILEFEGVPEEITTRKIVDNFLIGVGTTGPNNCDYGIKYFYKHLWIMI